MTIFVLKRNRKAQPREVQEKVMALDGAFRRPFDILFWVTMIFGVFFLAIFVLDKFYLRPSGYFDP